MHCTLVTPVTPVTVIGECLQSLTPNLIPTHPYTHRSNALHNLEERFELGSPGPPNKVRRVVYRGVLGSGSGVGVGLGSGLGSGLGLGIWGLGSGLGLLQTPIQRATQLRGLVCLCVGVAGIIGVAGIRVRGGGVRVRVGITGWG